MKRIISILLITIPTLIMLALAVIPHHHHKGVACIVMERCENDDAINDEHTNHRDTSGNENHSSNCIAETNFIFPKSNYETKCKVLTCDIHTHFFPIYFLVSDLVLFNAEHSFLKSKYREYISFYKSAEICRFHGLRAPPYNFSLV